MSFEKEYYESPKFWENGTITDAANLARISETIAMIPITVNTLLDVGCGNGVFPNKLSGEKLNLKITATDRSNEALKYVLTEKFASDISDIPVEDGKYDCVTCLQVIEHLPIGVYEQGLKELARVSNKYIIVSVPFNENVKKNFTQCPKCLAEFNADLHLRSYQLQTIENLFIQHDYVLIKSVNLVKTTNFAGVELYAKFKSLIKPQPKTFDSPVCPICGFKNDLFKSETHSANMSQNRLGRSLIKKAIKSIWPKVEIPGYWIIALYEKRTS